MYHKKTSIKTERENKLIQHPKTIPVITIKPSFKSSILSTTLCQPFPTVHLKIEPPKQLPPLVDRIKGKSNNSSGNVAKSLANRSHQQKAQENQKNPVYQKNRAVTVCLYRRERARSRYRQKEKERVGATEHHPGGRDSPGGHELLRLFLRQRSELARGQLRSAPEEHRRGRMAKRNGERETASGSEMTRVKGRRDRRESEVKRRGQRACVQRRFQRMERDRVGRDRRLRKTMEKSERTRSWDEAFGGCRVAMAATPAGQQTPVLPRRSPSAQRLCSLFLFRHRLLEERSVIYTRFLRGSFCPVLVNQSSGYKPWQVRATV